MKQVVWKYAVRPGRFRVEMPVGARILSVGEQFGEAQMWALVVPDAPKESRGFTCLVTGNETAETDLGDFIGTFQLANGALVFHLFEAVGS